MTNDFQRSLLQNAAIVLPVTLIHSAIYRYLTYHALFPTHWMQPTLFDRWLPFLVWTVWPYLAMVIVSVVAPLSVRRPRVFRMLVMAYGLSVVVLLMFYVFLPTSIARTPRTPEPGSWTWQVYLQFAEGLGGGCCFPSGHVIYPMIGCWAVYRDGRKFAPILAGLMAVSSLSILTIKEHVTWDWLGGVVVGVIVIGIAERLTCERPAAWADPPEVAFQDIEHEKRSAQ